MTKALRAVGITVGAVLASLVCLATPAQARALDPVVSAAMIRPGDLSGDYGRPGVSGAEDLGGGVSPTSCARPARGASVDGGAAASTYVKELAYPRSRVTFVNSVYTYPTVQAARASFTRMLSGSLLRCNSSFTGDIGDGRVVVLATIANRTTRLPETLPGVPRFAVYSATRQEDPTQVNRRYPDSWTYGVLLVNGSVITQLELIAASPVSARQRRDTARAVVAIDNRMGKLP